MENVREEFERWFLANAKAPIDPWHKEFAWAVWKAAIHNKTIVSMSEESLENIAVQIGKLIGTIPYSKAVEIRDLVISLIRIKE